MEVDMNLRNIMEDSKLIMLKINYKLCLIIFCLVPSIYVQSDSRNEEFMQNLRIACQNKDADQFFEIVSTPLLVILPTGRVLKVEAKEDFLNNLDRIFVDEFLEACSQFGKKSWFRLSYQPSPFSFMKRVHFEGETKINVLSVAGIIDNHRKGFFD